MIQMRKVFILFLSLFCLPTLYAASVSADILIVAKSNSMIQNRFIIA